VNQPVYLEKYGSAAFERLISLITKVKDSDSLAPITIIVPTAYAGISLRRNLSTKKGLINIRFMVSPRLAEYIGSPDLAQKDKTPLSPLIEMAAIRHSAINICAEKPLGDLALHPKLHSYVKDTFRDLAKLSDIGLISLAKTDPLRGQLVNWYQSYNSLINQYYSREDLSLSAAEAVDQSKVGIVLQDLGFIIYYLVFDFSPGELALLDELCKKEQCAVIIGLIAEPQIDQGVEKIAKHIAPDLKQISYEENQTQQHYKIDHILIASDAQEEIRWIIRSIIQHAEEGIPFHRMAIVYRQRDPYASLIRGQLHLSKIPIAGPDTTSLNDSPAGKLLRNLLDVIESDFARDKVLHCIAESPVKSSSDNQLASFELSYWEIITREAGIIKGETQWRERLTNYVDSLNRKIYNFENREEGTPAQLRGLSAQKESIRHLTMFMERLFKDTPPKDGSTWTEFTKWTKHLISKQIYHPNDWPKEHQDGYERVIALLDDLNMLDDLLSEGTDYSSYQMMLNYALESPAGRTGQTGAGVFVAPIFTVQAMEFDVLYIVGMAEGSFPPRLPDNPILPDHIREVIGENDYLPLRKSRAIRERRLFSAALMSAKKRILTYSRVDASAQRHQYPAPWLLDEVSKLYGSAVSSTDLYKLGSQGWVSIVFSFQHGLDYSQSLTPADIYDYDMSSISKWWGRNYPIEDHFLMVGGSPGLRAIQMEKGRNDRDFTVWDGNLSGLADSSHRLKLPQNSQFSPTRLERWATCPFRYFLNDVIGISVLERPEEVIAISPLDRGSLLHRIMERLVKDSRDQECIPDFGKPWNQSHKDLLLQIAEEEFFEVEKSGVTGRPMLWDITKKEMRLELQALLEHDSRWRAQEQSRPIWVERAFGFNRDNSLPAVILTLNNGSCLHLRGIIDRVDENKSRSKINIVDYKFGSSYQYSDMRDDPLGGGRHLQLPVYAMAVRNAIEESEEVTASYWFATAKGKYEMKAIALNEVEQRFVIIIETIVSGIEEGLFPANPLSLDNRIDNCRYCDFDRICPANRDLHWERKSQNSNMATYLKLGRLDTEEEANA
jgi:ATP-dependent helicase/nuclease subunit B